MARIPTTSVTLLRDLSGDSQHARWGEFAARYRPMMEAYMRERFPLGFAERGQTPCEVCGSVSDFNAVPL